MGAVSDAIADAAVEYGAKLVVDAVWSLKPREKSLKPGET
jgi:hypothetical protein